LNEDAIGEVFEQWLQSEKVKREELFIVTKVIFNLNNIIISIGF